MSDALDYDKSIIETIHHIEDILVKFAPRGSPVAVSKDNPLNVI